MGLRTPSKNFPYLLPNSAEFHSAWNDFLLSQEYWMSGTAHIFVDSVGRSDKGSVVGSGAWLAGHVSVFQLMQHYTVTVTGMKAHFDTVLGDVKGVIYGDNGAGFPGALIVAGNEVAAAAPLTTLTFASPITLYPGVYWMGIHAESTLTGAMFRVRPNHETRYTPATYASGVPDPHPTASPTSSTHTYPIYGDITLLSSDMTVDDNAANARVIRVAGAMTQNMTMTMPNRTSVFIVHNVTTGPYTLTVKTAAGSGTRVNQGAGGAFLYNDGSDVYPIDGAAATKVNYPILASDVFSLGMVESTGVIV